MVKKLNKDRLVTYSLIFLVGIIGIILFFIDKDQILESLQSNFVKGNNFVELFKGLGNTILITLVAFLCGVFIGTILCLIDGINSQNLCIILLKKVCKIYVSIFRGTPTMVQLLILYFVLFAFYKGNPLFVAILAFGLNSGAYVSEIIRGGIEAVPVGQMEAGRSLGLSYFKTMRKIVFPQALRNSFPSLGNELITLLKETSIVGFVGAVDLTLAFRKIANATYDYKTVYLVMGVVYFFLVFLIAAILKRIERRVLQHAKG